MTQKSAIKLSKIIKRDGRVVDYSVEKIASAIFKAASSVGGEDHELSLFLAKTVESELANNYDGKLGVDKVQDLVEKTLIEQGHAKTAKAFILHRYRKDEELRRKAIIVGEHQEEENLRFTAQALKILTRRYLLKDKNGQIIETPRDLLVRVANNVAKADKRYGASDESVKRTEKAFLRVMAELRFLPNSPTLMNAGTKTQQLSSCFVLPVEDTMEGIFGTLKDAAVIHQRGSGTGFSFSRLRPRGDVVGKNRGVASGSVDFLKVFDSALEVIKQGGVRPGANMAVLRVDHPDIIRFIESKRDKKALKNFNISVGITDRFMKAVEDDRYYFLTNPRTGKFVGKLRAKDVFAVITQNAWKTGDPGLIFIDEINRKHPAQHLGEIETTNQCGEAPLLPYEGCVLGSINLNTIIKDGEVDWETLRETVRTAVHFLDNVIDMNSYPKKIVERTTKHARKFGLGIMGFADLLIKTGVKYDSEEGLAAANKLMGFIKEQAYQRSMEIAESRGVCEAYSGSEHEKAGRKMRNMTCISVSPTGTISILADSSSGCEPLFAISYQKTVMGDTDFVYLNKHFETIAHKRGFYSPELIRRIAHLGGIQTLKEIPKDVRDIFVTSQDIKPEWHIKMQATLQKHVDNSISKTINFPRSASIRDIEEAYILAWKMKCKGITIYRDGSYEEQVINIGE